ncbi:peptide deformylase [Candidatus Tremblaya phenacola PAVE]|nr:peptide deformylase [Candidatus Tremblaya phenacola PAVE]
MLTINGSMIAAFNCMKQQLSLKAGLGLSGIQIRFGFCAMITYSPAESALAVGAINPQLTFRAVTSNLACQEGCLSIPGLFVLRRRPVRILLKFLLLKAGWVRSLVLLEKWGGLQSICLQHEMDHLIGKSIGQLG